MKPIYLDYNATTPLAAEVVEAMLPYLKEYFGNPSSGHIYGREAKEAVARARGELAGLLGCAPEEVVFTGGGSESINQALKGVALAHRARGNHIITSRIEHPAVLNTCRYLEKQGFEVAYLPVDEYGMVDPEQVAAAVSSRTILISIMHANNEVGTIQPIAAIAEIARRHGIYLHTDAAQSVGKIPTKVDELQVDLLTVAAHKFYGPKGVGALYLRRGTVLEPLVHGAGHEDGRRAGTENVAGIVALGRASAMAAGEMGQRVSDLTGLRDYFFQLLQERVPGVVLNGHPQERLPNTLNVSFAGVNGAELLARVPEIAASTGSACHHGAQTVSAVLAAMGLGLERGLGAVRLSLGRWTTRAEVEQAVTLLAEQAAALRNTV